MVCVSSLPCFLLLTSAYVVTDILSKVGLHIWVCPLVTDVYVMPGTIYSSISLILWQALQKEHLSSAFITMV